MPAKNDGARRVPARDPAARRAVHRIDACPRPAAAPDKSEASAAEAIAKRAAKGGKWFEDMCETLTI